MHQVSGQLLCLPTNSLRNISTDRSRPTGRSRFAALSTSGIGKVEFDPITTAGVGVNTTNDPGEIARAQLIANSYQEGRPSGRLWPAQSWVPAHTRRPAPNGNTYQCPRPNSLKQESTMAGDGSSSQVAAKDAKSDSDTNGTSKSKDSTPTAAPSASATESNKSPRKRRKVNHGMPYLAARIPLFTPGFKIEVERPCTRCIKRNIAHLCHDEPRDPDAKKSKSGHSAAGQDESESQSELPRSSIDQNDAAAMGPPSFNGNGASQSSKQGFGAGAGALGQANHLQLVSPNPVSGMQANASSSNMNQFAGFSDAWLTAQNQFHDMHSYNPQYMLAPEVTHEFNLLNDFLNTSLLDDTGALPDDQNVFRSSQSDMAGASGGNHLLPPGATQGTMLPPSADQGGSISRPASVIPTDKTRDFYLQAADPSGNDTPEERMQRVLKAKFDAGLLKPFNYIKGYARLGKYMDSHIASSSKQKILRQLDRFRPKFREKIHNLTDMELIYVEMWFERTLLEYDRVFAAMAVPACCWRRTGEIFRGNKEMAELIHVPVERLRDGKISLHEILTEDSLVRYWEEFGTIAFDPAHDSLLTACALKNPDDQSHDPIVNCCFSFMIRRDDHKIPSLIVGNFLPHDPAH
ncbi:transcriptional regulator [Seiridium cupressi]